MPDEFAMLLVKKALVSEILSMPLNDRQRRYFTAEKTTIEAAVKAASPSERR